MKILIVLFTLVFIGCGNEQCDSINTTNIIKAEKEYYNVCFKLQSALSLNHIIGYYIYSGHEDSNFSERFIDGDWTYISEFIIHKDSIIDIGYDLQEGIIGNHFTVTINIDNKTIIHESTTPSEDKIFFEENFQNILTNWDSYPII